MGEWRYYAQRATNGLWLDNDVQLQDLTMDWSLSAPNSGDAYLPEGMLLNPKASDGRLLWSRWDTMLLAEEDGDLAWAGICTGANPDEKGYKLEFVGPSGWLQRVPYTGALQVWESNAFDVARSLIRHSLKYNNRLEFELGHNNSEFTVGDEQPPHKPKEPARKKGESKTEFYDSKRYKQYKDDLDEWNKKYSERKRFEVVWWDSPYVGEELDSLAKEVGFDYRERVAWADKGALTPKYAIDLSDHFAKRRDDIKFVDGMNLAAPLDTKDGDQEYANHVLGLGAGEGKAMVRAGAGVNDGRLYQAEFMQYKGIRNEKRLRALAEADLKRLSNTDPDIDNVVIWDIPGYASVSTLRCGDEVEVVSDNHTPAIASWRRVVSISRNPVESVVTVGLESS